jgi:diguanylate cyclase (GGDEF)-like protein
MGNVASTLPVIPILIRVRRRSPLRLAWSMIGVGIALYSAGNVLYLFYDQNLNPIPSPAPSDAVYLLSYLALVIGVAMMTQRAFGIGHTSIRLDGAVAGLAIGSISVMLWFRPILNASGHPLEVIVGMAYPLCDVVLLVLLVAGIAPRRFRLTLPVALLVAGVLAFVVGDIIYLNQIAVNTYVGGTPLDGTWVVGTFLMGLAAWPRGERRARARDERATPPGVALIPVTFGFLSLAVVGISLFHKTSPVAVGMALAALGVMIVRMALTLREVREATSRSFRDARTDALTGLQNRRSFTESLERECRALGDDHNLGVLLLDLDHFKEVNDSLGHHVGDDLLRIVAQRFQEKIAGRGDLARIGGDEFACWFVTTTRARLIAFAHELVDGLADPITLDGVSVKVGASVGVALSPDDGSNAAELLRSADVAMYEAKRTQSAVCSYQPKHDVNSREQLTMINDLRVAIVDRALTLNYQPTLDMHSGRVYGVEALVRWQHPTRGLLYPDAFVPLAERTGLIPELTRAVLELAIEEASHLEGLGHVLQMSVNISRYDLVDEELPMFIDRLLDHYRVPHHRLTLEVTESCLATDPEHVSRSIRNLRMRGIRISIDDFGVGYSSMSQLLALPIDELKIDKSFILALETDARAGAIISSAVELGRALNLTIVAEGVENAQSLELLKRLGADVAQGFQIARPLTVEKLHKYLGDPLHALTLLTPPIPEDAFVTVDRSPN